MSFKRRLSNRHGFRRPQRMLTKDVRRNTDRSATCANHVDVVRVRSVFLQMSVVNILRGLPCRLESQHLTLQWAIYFCRWGIGWVNKAQYFRSARRFGAVGSNSSLDFSRVFSRHLASRHLNWSSSSETKRSFFHLVAHVISSTCRQRPRQVSFDDNKHWQSYFNFQPLV